MYTFNHFFKLHLLYFIVLYWMPIKIFSTCLVYVVCGWGIHSGRAQYRDELFLTLRANNSTTRSVFSAVLRFFNLRPTITVAKLKHQRISQAGAEREREERDFTSINLADVFSGKFSLSDIWMEL